jgi:hypothetical protein
MTGGMKIGILTLHRVANPGAHLQCSALVGAVQRMGHVVEVIDYAPGDYPKRLADFVALTCHRVMKNPRQAVGTLRHMWGLYQHFQAAQSDIHSLPLSPRVETRGDLRALKYDRVIVGSDEIWNVRNPATGGDPAYFGAGFDLGSVCSYAPSFGAVTSASEVLDEALHALKTLKRISCRDRNSKNLLESLGLESKIVLDPTLLGREVAKETLPRSGPIVIYGPPLNDATIGALESAASKRGIKLISMIFPQRTAVRHISRVDSRQFQDVIASASAVVTGTFHGVIFSLLAGKPFAAVGVGEKANKIGHLIETFALGGRATEEPSEIVEWLDAPLDTSRINHVLRTETKCSLDYLSDAIA